MTRRWPLLAAVVGALLLGGVAVAASPPGIVTVAGTGTAGTTGDGGPAASAEIGHPRGIAFAPGGGFVFSEPFLHVVRRVWPDGTITTIAGTGTPGYSGDGGPATEAELDLPHGVSFTPAGGLLIADDVNHRIRLVAPDGTISTVAGTGRLGFSGDGGPATAAEIGGPRGVAALPDGGFVFPDTDNERVRRVWPDGTITTVAGDGAKGYGGDGGPATAAELNAPFAVAPLPDGGFLIADASNDRIRRVWPDGTITTVAGDGTKGYGGDGGPATDAALDTPHAVAPLPDGGFLVADTFNNRVRRVWPDGTITTVAGTGTGGFSGDGGAADTAELDEPKALAVEPDLSGFLVGDALNNRIRLVTVDLRPPFTIGLAPRSLHVRSGLPAVVHVTLSLPAAVEIDVLSGGRVVLHLEASRNAGRSSLIFGRPLAPGRYRFVVTAHSADGRTLAPHGALTVTRR